MGGMPSKHVYYLGWNRSPAQDGCMRQVLRPGALGKPRGSGWRGRWEGGSEWGTHINPWLFHFNVWQNPPQIKKKEKRKKNVWARVEKSRSETPPLRIEERKEQVPVLENRTEAFKSQGIVGEMLKQDKIFRVLKKKRQNLDGFTSKWNIFCQLMSS